MKAVKAFGPGDLRLVDVPDPVPSNGQVLIAVRASGICGSDKWYWYANEPVDMIAGHEIAGDVVAVGPQVRNLQVGDRVAVNNVVGCGRCEPCGLGQYVRCSNRQISDINGGFGLLAVAPEANCLLLEENVGYEAGCLIFDNWGTPFAALERAGVDEGDVVAVWGCGPIGLGGVVLSKLAGASVIAIDPLAYRLETATQLGADATLQPGENIEAEIKELTSGAGPTVILECSGDGAVYKPGLASLCTGGTFIAIGEGAQVDLLPSEYLIRNHLNLMGSWYSTMEQGLKVQELMTQGIINPSAFVSHRIYLQDLPAFFGSIVECKDNVLKTVILND